MAAFLALTQKILVQIEVASAKDADYLIASFIFLTSSRAAKALLLASIK